MKMNRLAALVALAVLVAGCEKAPEEKKDDTVEITTKEQKLSYIFGQNIGGQFKAEGMDVDVTAFSAGVQDALSDAEPKLAQDDVIAVLESFQQEQIAAREAENSALADKNQAEGDAFLAENGKKEGVVTLESGLQYKILEEGDGPSPAAEDTVEVHYTGTLIDGTEFDSSHRRGVPATFGVNQVIPGWTEALQLMKEGAKWQLVIPPALAYGPGGTGGPIGPNQTLIFEVELLKAKVEE
ncbi:MAG: FKBP-type peptidyl-prolyl cis-trans isomerase [Porticoccaceae bacterium]|nr:FKBP-type peptidyl-prolyl cis-trans isomerase [Porticoccaceae bacterium]MEA3298852.1 FKBP-type peptidyl-prolyl cis-trans isomerase [Pseudomonadota bacterium]HLS97515.1 FKBP-type peptidyl-prolyl cis-trans isomerase [Porticoccaceae bacterium]